MTAHPAIDKPAEPKVIYLITEIASEGIGTVVKIKHTHASVTELMSAICPADTGRCIGLQPRDGQFRLGRSRRIADARMIAVKSRLAIISKPLNEWRFL